MATAEGGHEGDGAALRGARVLVAEDSALIAGRVAGTLRDAGCVVVGPVPTLAAGLALARRASVARAGVGPLGAAVLDINLRGEPAYPLAEALGAVGVPVLFLTGYGWPALPPRWRATPRVEKPFDPAALLATLGGLLAGHAVAPRGSASAADPAPVVRRSWEAIRRSRDLASESQILVERAAREQRRPGDDGGG